MSLSPRNVDGLAEEDSPRRRCFWEAREGFGNNCLGGTRSGRKFIGGTGNPVSGIDGTREGRLKVKFGLLGEIVGIWSARDE